MKKMPMIQISLSTYNEHKSKAEDLFKKTVGSEKRTDASCSLLDYYRNRIHGVTDSKEIKCMYVYISPKEFFSQTNLSKILGDVGTQSHERSLLWFDPQTFRHRPVYNYNYELVVSHDSTALCL